MKKNTQVLVLMPMLPGYEAIRETVARTISESKVTLIWLEDLLEDWEWLEWLYSSVQSCDIIVANPSKHNPFVMYELGVARQYKLPTLIMLDREDSQLTGSLDGSSFLPYSKFELDNFACRFREDLNLAIQSVTNNTNPMYDFLECYQIARNLVNRFENIIGQCFDQVNENEFVVRLRHSSCNGTFFPNLLGTSLGDIALLTAIIRSSRMVDTMTKIHEWVNLRRIDSNI